MINHLNNLLVRYRCGKLPRYVNLGQVREDMYFIDCYSSKIYKLSRDFRGEREYIATIMEL